MSKVIELPGNGFLQDLRKGQKVGDWPLTRKHTFSDYAFLITGLTEANLKDCGR